MVHDLPYLNCKPEEQNTAQTYISDLAPASITVTQNVSFDTSVSSHSHIIR